jgi:uncharacterized protein (TIGR03437 family)
MTPLAMEGNSGGPPIGNTGAPGNATCATIGCHTNTGNPFSEGISIDFGAGGATYTPGGARQTWALTAPTSTAGVYGFQMTARRASDARNTPAGTFTASAGQAVLCADGGLKPTAGCAASTPIEYLEHDGSPLRANPITIQWTPPATDIGDVTIYVAVNSANGNGSNTGDRITVQNFTLKAATTQPSTPQIRATQPVLQSFSGKAGISPGTWMEIYGTNLSATTREWAGGDFTANGTKAPTALDGVRVKVAGKDAFVRYISPTQINVQAPDDIGTGNAIAVEVTNANGTGSTTVSAARVSPALLTTPSFLVGGRQYLAALFPDNTTFVGRANLIAGVAFRPAKPGDTIIIYAVGCGATTPASPAGDVSPAPRPLASPITVRFGETAATAQAFVGGIGLCQFNVVVPNVAVGDIAIEATVDGVAAGQNLFTTIGN